LTLTSVKRDNLYCMTTWAPELPTDRPLYQALAEAVARDINAGVLAPAERLPTQRALSQRLGIALTTVTRGYAEAERRGLISSHVGRGTFVCPPDGAPSGEGGHPGSGEEGGHLADLRGNSLLPWPLLPELREGLARIAARAAVEEVLGYTPHGGLPRHRVAGARLAAAAGLSVPPERVLVTAGVQHAMTVVFSTLLAPGDTLLVEELTYAGIKSLAHLLRLRLRPVPMDREGLLPDALAAACAESGARALYCMPVNQNPTTAVMSPARCQAVAEVAVRAGIAVIEDDSYGFLLPRAPRLAILLSGVADAYWLTGTSKGLLPALRIGFLSAPAAMTARLEGAISATAYFASPLLAEVVARWVEDGTAERVHLWKREEVGARQEIAARALSGLAYRAHAASPHGWLELAEPWATADAVAGAAARGVQLTPAAAFAVARDTPHAVRLCLGPVRSRATLAAALATLAGMLHEAPDPGRAVA
jgi:DNA-binding transcriptional MocR family regulator